MTEKEEIQVLEKELNIKDYKVKETNTWFFDFETYTLESDYYKLHNTVGIGLIYGEHLFKDDKMYGITPEDFINFIIKESKRKALEIGFHNLKFDISYLIKKLFLLCSPKYNNQSINNYNDTTKTQIKLEPGEYTNFTNNFGMVYGYEFKLPNSKYKIKFIDTLKILPGSIDSFSKFTPYHKEKELNITKLPIFNSFEEATPEWKSRIINDVKIGKYMWLQLKSLPLPKGITAGSIAYKDLKKEVGKTFYHHYGQISTLEEWQIYANSYKGGFVSCNSKTNNKILKLPKSKHTKGFMCDIGSSYPNQAVNYDQPYGLPTLKQKGKTITLLKVECFNIKLKKNKIPCLSVENNQIGAKKEVIINQSNKMTFTIWEKEFEFIKTIYDIKYKLINEYHFLADKTISKWFNKMYKLKRYYKLTENYAMEKIIKIYINAPTGKFGENPKKYRKKWKTYIPKEEFDLLPPWKKNQYCCFKSHIKRLNYKTSRVNAQYIHECEEEEISAIFKYVPLISHITSGGRLQLFEFINYKNNALHFKYCDTDSALFCCQEKIELPPGHSYGNNLGQWNIEFINIDYIHTIREKCYRIKGIEVKSGLYKTKTAISGFNKEEAEKIKDEDFKIGFKGVRLKQIRTLEGIILKEVDFEIKDNYKKWGK